MICRESEVTTDPKHSLRKKTLLVTQCRRRIEMGTYYDRQLRMAIRIQIRTGLCKTLQLSLHSMTKTKVMEEGQLKNSLAFKDDCYDEFSY